MEILKVEHVTKRFARHTALDDVSLTIPKGSVYGLLGPNGAGKTTLVNLLMRFYDIDAGTITIDGVNTVLDTRSDVRSNFGMVLQDAWLFSGTIRENIAYGAKDPELSLIHI